MKVRVLYFRKTGPYLRTRDVSRKLLQSGEYQRIKFRRKTGYVQVSTLQKMRVAALPIAQPDQKALLPEPGTETFTVRDDHSGAFTKKKKGRGKSTDVKIEFSVQVKGTQDERDRAFERLDRLFKERFPFLEKKGRIGRSEGGSASGGKVEVLKSRFNNRRSSTAARAVLFELLEEVS